MNVRCFCCQVKGQKSQKYGHSIIDCPFMHFVKDKSFQISRHNFSLDQNSVDWRRKWRRGHDARSKMKLIKPNVKKIRKKLNKLCNLVKKKIVSKTMFQDISTDSSDDAYEKDYQYFHNQPYKIKFDEQNQNLLYQSDNNSDLTDNSNEILIDESQYESNYTESEEQSEENSISCREISVEDDQSQQNEQEFEQEDNQIEQDHDNTYQPSQKSSSQQYKTRSDNSQKKKTRQFSSQMLQIIRQFRFSSEENNLINKNQHDKSDDDFTIPSLEDVDLANSQQQNKKIKEKIDQKIKKIGMELQFNLNKNKISEKNSKKKTIKKVELENKDSVYKNVELGNRQILQRKNTINIGKINSPTKAHKPKSSKLYIPENEGRAIRPSVQKLSMQIAQNQGKMSQTLQIPKLSQTLQIPKFQKQRPTKKSYPKIVQSQPKLPEIRGPHDLNSFIDILAKQIQYRISNNTVQPRNKQKDLQTNFQTFTQIQDVNNFTISQETQKQELDQLFFYDFDQQKSFINYFPKGNLEIILEKIHNFKKQKDMQLRRNLKKIFKKPNKQQFSKNKMFQSQKSQYGNSLFQVIEENVQLSRRHQPRHSHTGSKRNLLVKSNVADSINEGSNRKSILSDQQNIEIQKPENNKPGRVFPLGLLQEKKKQLEQKNRESQNNQINQ